MSPTVGSGEDQRMEARRRLVVRAVFFLYILSLIEGPLRKWLLPQFSGPITLMRDPVAIAIYLYALNSGLLLRRGMGSIWLGFSVAASVFGLVQFAMQGHGIAAWALGVRTYWLYMPLAFVIARTFRKDDLLRFLRLNLWVCLPYALLVAQQYNSGASAFINRGIAGDDANAVGLGDGILRPFGLFTYTGPNVQFTAGMVATLIAMFLAGRERGLSFPIFLLIAAAVGAMSVLTGSRSIYFLVGIMLIFTVTGLLIARPNVSTIVRIMGIAGFVLLAAALFVMVFPDMLAAMGRRFESAASLEGSIWNRAIGGLLDSFDAFHTAPAFGYGIGAGAPGVARFIGLPPHAYGEGDLDRNINELGIILGSAMVLLRFVTATCIALRALRLAVRGMVFILPLAGFVLHPLLLGQITNSPLNSFLVWVYVGLVLSAGAGKGPHQHEQQG